MLGFVQHGVNMWALFLAARTRSLSVKAVGPSSWCRRTSVVRQLVQSIEIL